MKLFDFFTKLIKTVAKLLFPKKYHRLENDNQEKPTKTRVGEAHTVGTPTVSISPAVPPLNTVRRTIQKPEPQPTEPGVAADDEVVEHESLPAAPEGYAPALSYGVVHSGLKEDETHTLVITRRTPSWSTMDAGITLPETPRR